MLHWAVSFLGRGRSERTATEQQIFARTALARLKRGAADLVSAPGEYDADAPRPSARRAELEAQALEEARLTDAGERGVKTSSAPASDRRLTSLEVARRLRPVLRRMRLARPPGQDEDALGLDGDARRRPRMWPLAKVLMPSTRSIQASAAQVAERGALAVARGSACRSCPGLPPAPAASPSIWSRISADDAAVHQARRALVGRAEVEVAPDPAVARRVVLDHQRRRDRVAQPDHGVAPGPAAAGRRRSGRRTARRAAPCAAAR